MTQNDIDALLNLSASFEAKIEVLPKVAGESIITLTNYDSIKKWVYSDLRNVPKQGFIGQFVARTLDGELQDISDDFNIQDREIVLYFGVRRAFYGVLTTENGNNIVTEDENLLLYEGPEETVTYYKLGNFFVEKPSSDEVQDSTKFKSMDYTILFNKVFNPDYTDSIYIKSFNQKLEDEESTTALWLLQYVCRQAGVELGNTDFKNNDFAITSNQYNSDYTLRDVVKSIAKLAYSWARIDWDNKLYLDFEVQDVVDDNNKINNNYYYTLETQKEKYGPVNRVVVGSSIVIGNSEAVEDAESIAEYGLTELDIYDNPILYTQELREEALEVADDIFGLEYTPLKMKTTGHPWLKGNELIEVSDMENNKLYTYPLDRVLTYDGGIEYTISSIADTRTESTYTYNGVDKTSKEVKRSKVELDRQNQVLSVALENISENASDITQLNLDLNGLDLRVTSTEGDINTLQGNVVDLQNQIDGVITYYTSNAIPEMTPTPNYPASMWDPQDYDNHLSDVCDVLQNSQIVGSYKFVYDNNEYKWVRISDSEIALLRNDLSNFENTVASTYVTQSDFNVSNTQIYSTISSTETTVKVYADGKASTAQTNAQTYASNVANAAQTNAQTYADGKASTAEQNAKDYADGINSTTNESLNELSGTVDSLNTGLTTAQGNIDTLTANQENFATKISLETLTQSVTTLQTNTYTKTEINTKLTDGSVTKVDTTTGFTMDSTGFHVDKTGAETNSTLDEKGLSVKDSSGNDVSYQGYVDSAKVVDNPNLIAYEGQTVTYQENAVINHYLQLPNSRIEEYSGGTGVFFTG